jgi:hypothetical protein
MKKITLVLDVAGFIAVGGAANVGAQSPNPYARGSVQGSSPVSNVPETAFFVGFGGSYNWSTLETRTSLPKEFQVSFKMGHWLLLDRLEDLPIHIPIPNPN